MIIVKVVSSSTYLNRLFTSNMNELKNNLVKHLVYYGATASTVLLCFLVNYKLYGNVSKEKHGDSGKALQWITRVCALSRAIGYPTLIIALNISVVIVRAYGDLLDPCIVINIVHILVFCFTYLRAYVALHSLILAFGRYAFVVHHGPILQFGQIRFGNILKNLSFTIPLFTTLLALSVATVPYKGWFSAFKTSDRLCSFPDNDKLESNKEDNLYRSPIYNLAHSWISSLAMDFMYVVFVVTSGILYSNITEGIVYIKSAIFVNR